MLFNLFIDFINFIIKTFGNILNFIFSFLPDSPFSKIDNSAIVEFVGYLNYLVPVAEIVSILTVWGSAIGIYYVYQIVLRWIRAVD